MYIIHYLWRVVNGDFGIIVKDYGCLYAKRKYAVPVPTPGCPVATVKLLPTV